MQTNQKIVLVFFAVDLTTVWEIVRSFDTKQGAARSRLSANWWTGWLMWTERRVDADRSVEREIRRSVIGAQFVDWNEAPAQVRHASMDVKYGVTVFTHARSGWARLATSQRRLSIPSIEYTLACFDHSV